MSNQIINRDQTPFKFSIPWWFRITVVLFCFLLFLSELINGRFWQSDFKVYYLASQALQSGDQVYGIPFGLGSGFYKYSPFFLLLIAPYTFFSFKTAAILYYFTNTAVLLLVFFQIDKLLLSTLKLEKFKSYKWVFVIIFLFSLNLIYRELHLGNTNLLLLLLILLLMNYATKSRHIISGLLLTLILIIKPFLLILILPMLFFKKSRVIIFAGGFGIIQFLIILLIFGSAKFNSLHFDWFSSISDHAGSFPSNNNMGHYLKLIFEIKPPEYLSAVLYVLLAIVYSLYYFLLSERFSVASHSSMLFVFHSLFLAATLPSILNTDSEHFLLSLPLISIIAYHILRNFNWWILLLFIFTFILYGTNTNDLVGKTIGDFYDMVGVVGIANFIILVWSLWFLNRIGIHPRKAYHN
jgi:hypothetical protein